MSRPTLEGPGLTPAVSATPPPITVATEGSLPSSSAAARTPGLRSLTALGQVRPAEKTRASVEVSVRVRGLNAAEVATLPPSALEFFDMTCTSNTQHNSSQLVPALQASASLYAQHVLQAHSVEKSIIVPTGTNSGAAAGGAVGTMAGSFSSPRSSRRAQQGIPSSSATPAGPQCFTPRACPGQTPYSVSGTTACGEGQRFQFDNVFWSVPEMKDAAGMAPVGQTQVYEAIGEPLVEHAFSGFNSCLFAYGQTGSGKTYTMMGPDGTALGASNAEAGIIPRVCEDIFRRKVAAERDGMVQWGVEIGYVEVYNERVSDLLAKRKRGKEEEDVYVEVRENPAKGVYLDGQKFVSVGSVEEVLQVLEKGNRLRHTASTKMNNRSSRSHAILMIVLKEQREMITREEGAIVSRVMTAGVSSRMNLVDLAGSERVAQSEVEGMQFNEATHINLSLTTLGRVIDILADVKVKKSNYIPFRESKLTHILKESLQGNSKTFMIATVSPSLVHVGETISTLRYASRARDIVNVVQVNEDPRARMIRELEAELQLMQQQLCRAVDASVVQGLEQQVMEATSALREAKERHRMEVAGLRVELVAERQQGEERVLQQDHWWEQRLVAVRDGAAQREHALLGRVTDLEQQLTAIKLERRADRDHTQAEIRNKEAHFERMMAAQHQELQEHKTVSEQEAAELRAAHAAAQREWETAIQRLQQQLSNKQQQADEVAQQLAKEKKQAHDQKTVSEQAAAELRAAHAAAQREWETAMQRLEAQMQAAAADHRIVLSEALQRQATELAGQQRADRLEWKVQVQRLQQERRQLLESSERRIARAEAAKDTLEHKVAELEGQMASTASKELDKEMARTRSRTLEEVARQEERTAAAAALQSEAATAEARLEEVEEKRRQAESSHALELLVAREAHSRLLLEREALSGGQEMLQRPLRRLAANLSAKVRELEARLVAWRSTARERLAAAEGGASAPACVTAEGRVRRHTSASASPSLSPHRERVRHRTEAAPASSWMYPHAFRSSSATAAQLPLHATHTNTYSSSSPGKCREPGDRPTSTAGSASPLSSPSFPLFHRRGVRYPPTLAGSGATPWKDAITIIYDGPGPGQETYEVLGIESRDGSRGAIRTPRKTIPSPRLSDSVQLLGA